MFPGMESIGAGSVHTQPKLRQEVEKAIDAYKSPQPLAVSGAETAAKVAKPEPREGKTESATEIRIKDQAEISFSLSREEREAFRVAFNSKHDSETMTEEEKETLRKASERITTFIEGAITRNADNRERIEKAVGEWYTKITQGEQRPLELIKLLRQAAMGQLEDFTE